MQGGQLTTLTPWARTSPGCGAGPEAQGSRRPARSPAGLHRTSARLLTRARTGLCTRCLHSPVSEVGSLVLGFLCPLPAPGGGGWGSVSAGPEAPSTLLPLHANCTGSREVCCPLSPTLSGSQ